MGLLQKILLVLLLFFPSTSIFAQNYNFPTRYSDLEISQKKLDEFIAQSKLTGAIFSYDTPNGQIGLQLRRIYSESIPVFQYTEYVFNLDYY